MGKVVEHCDSIGTIPSREQCNEQIFSANVSRSECCNIARTPVLAVAAATLAGLPLASSAAGQDWPTYNRTLTSERFAALDAINTKNVKGLKILCTYDTGEQTGFVQGLLQIDGMLFATTEHDTFSIDPNSCVQNWRAHEEFTSGVLKVNRGLAWLDGRVYRGHADGGVLGYALRNGKLCVR